MAVIILSMMGWYSTESICVKQMDCNWCAVYPCDFFWWPIRLFTQWKHVKTSAFKQVVTAKRYCLEIQAVNAFFSCFGQRLCMALLQKEINKIAEFILCIITPWNVMILHFQIILIPSDIKYLNCYIQSRLFYEIFYCL